MKQGTTSTPNRGSFNRLTATAIWFPTGLGYGFHLGIIDMHQADEGIQREKVQMGAEGGVRLLFDEVVSVAPIWTLKGKQFHSTILPLIYMGSASGNIAQSIGTGTVVSLSAQLGKTFDLGYRSITSVVVTVAAITKLINVDYYIEPNKGLIRFPTDAAGIAEGDAVDITFNRPALTREAYIAFNQLNQAGQLMLFEMDGRVVGPLTEIFMPGTISSDKANEGDPLKTNQWALRFALEGQPTILKSGDWDNLLLDDDTILEFA
jgi:hypothetical protein